MIVGYYAQCRHYQQSINNMGCAAETDTAEKQTVQIPITITTKERPKYTARSEYAGRENTMLRPLTKGLDIMGSATYLRADLELVQDSYQIRCTAQKAYY